MPSNPSAAPSSQSNTDSKMQLHLLTLFRAGLFSLTGVLIAMAMPSHGAIADAGVEALDADERSRLLVMGTAIGEMVFAFGYGDAVVARDLSCEHPPEIEQKPAVGYFRQISAEGVLSLQPSAILTTEAAGPPNALRQLEASGTPLYFFSAEPKLSSLRENIQRMGQVLGASDRAAGLLRQLDADLASIPEAPKERASVLFLLSPPGSDRLLAAGSDTVADRMIRLAGADNAFADLKGYQPVSSEVIAQRRPDIILLPGGGEAMSADASAGHTVIDRLVEQKHSRVVRIDISDTLAFGVRTGRSARELHDLIYE